MADTKITGLTAYSVAANNDVLPIVDISDSTMAPSGTDKQITIPQLLGSGVAPALALAPAAAPNPLASGQSWLDSTQLAPMGYDGLSYALPRMIYNQIANVSLTSTGATTVINTSGTPSWMAVALPAGYLNVLGRILRCRFNYYATTAASGAGNLTVFGKLGTTGVVTSGALALLASKTNVQCQGSFDIVTKTTSSSGKLDCFGVISTQTLMTIVNIPLQNSNSGGTTVAPGTQVALDLTTAYTFDLQFNLTATGNTINIVTVSLEVIG